jgi:hypothetical protein
MRSTPAPFNEFAIAFNCGRASQSYPKRRDQQRNAERKQKENVRKQHGFHVEGTNSAESKPAEIPTCTREARGESARILLNISTSYKQRNTFAECKSTTVQRREKHTKYINQKQVHIARHNTLTQSISLSLSQERQRQDKNNNCKRHTSGECFPVTPVPGWLQRASAAPEMG